MKLEQQVVGLELAKKLKELGFKQESLFGWLPFGKGFGLFYDYALSKDEHIPAYTVAELGEMLPRADVLAYDNNRWIEITKNSDGHWNVKYKTNKDLIQHAKADTEADARAKMLIYLKENNLLRK